MAKDKSKSGVDNLLRDDTLGYRPSNTSPIRAFVNINRPLFYRAKYIPEMLRDPRVSFGVKLIKGPILSKARFKIETKDEELKQSLIRQITKFWTKAACVSLHSIIYGFSGSQVIYKFNKEFGLMEFHNLKHLKTHDVRPLIGKDTDEIVAVAVKGIKHKGLVYLRPTKFLWCVHEKTHHRWFGRSRLEGAFIPWYEQWMPRGYRSIRQMWFYKNAYTSVSMRVPHGSTKDSNGELVPNMRLAQEIADRYVTGSSALLPRSPDGDNDWELEPGKSTPVPDGLLEYGEVLGNEIWEGMGIPPEVVSAGGTGAFAGRRIPQQAYYSVLQEVINEHIFDFDDQVLRPMAILNHGHDDYEINPISLLDTLQQEEMGLITGDAGPEETEEGSEQEPGEPGKVPPKKPTNGKIEDRASNSHNRNERIVADNQKGE